MGTTDKQSLDQNPAGFEETEGFMNQKQYNMVMIKARQTLEYMIHFLAEQALIVKPIWLTSIDQLYEGLYIPRRSKITTTGSGYLVIKQYMKAMTVPMMLRKPVN